MKKVKERGFTLTELGIGIAILGMAFLIALPPVHSFFCGLKLESTARKIRGDLVYAHQRAIATHSAYEFAIQPDNQGYEIRNIDRNEVILVYTLPSFLTFDGTQDREISFYHNGNTTGGWIRLRKQDDSRRFQIGVALTGHIVVDPRGW